MIKTKVSQLLEIKPVLQQLAATKMAARDSFTVLRVLKIIDKEYETIESTQRKMLDNYAAKNENGEFVNDGKGGIVIVREHMDVFAKEMQELYDTEIELDCDKLKFQVFDNVELSPNQLMGIEDFVDTEE